MLQLSYGYFIIFQIPKMKTVEVTNHYRTKLAFEIQPSTRFMRKRKYSLDQLQGRRLLILLLNFCPSNIKQMFLGVTSSLTIYFLALTGSFLCLFFHGKVQIEINGVHTHNSEGAKIWKKLPWSFIDVTRSWYLGPHVDKYSSVPVWLLIVDFPSYTSDRNLFTSYSWRNFILIKIK